MKILFKIKLSEFASDIGFDSHLNSILYKLSNELQSDFKYSVDIEIENNFHIESSVPVVKNNFIPTFQELLIDLYKNDEQCRKNILKGLKIDYKLETATTDFHENKDLDNFIWYINQL